MALAEAGRVPEAILQLREALRLQPGSADGWRLLADYLDHEGDTAAADSARARYIKAATRDPRLVAAAAALVENDLPSADRRLRAHLHAFPSDVAALRMLAEVAGRLRQYDDAQALLSRCLSLAPSFDAARHNYAVVLNRAGKPAAALPHVQQLLLKEPRNPAYLNLKAAILANIGDYEGAAALYEGLLATHGGQSKIWMSYGHVLRTAGRVDRAVLAYRRSLALEPTLGEAWWSLANLKTFEFAQSDVEAMSETLAEVQMTEEDRLHFEFALGKASEDRAEYERAFGHYANGNRIRLRSTPYDPDENSRFVARSKELFTTKFFLERMSAGASSDEPIFIVGLPRAGSTLLEQILSSHSLVEGTAELPDVPQLVRDLAETGPSGRGAPFLDALAALGPDALRELGERYLDATRIRRRSDAPHFIDKMPNNCLYVGFIHLILPNARIIDARRHPLGCCFSAFKQQFARGQNFTYDLEHIGRYYRDYVELMAHFDAVLPNRVHRVFYESMIEDTSAEVRNVLEYCRLPFEESCLKFYENARPVKTPSSQQVRQPIYRDGLMQWKHFDPWLEPLRNALGEVLDEYPKVPGFGTLAAAALTGD